MAQTNQIEVYLEVGSKRAMASAVHWPGWTRGGRDEESALKSLFEYAPRYARALLQSDLGFLPPADLTHCRVVERLAGDATTDFGAPSAVTSADFEPIDETELARLQAILSACWEALDAASEAAAGKALRKGPRGGGRELDEMLHHLLEAEQAYLGKIGHQIQMGDATNLFEMQARVRQAITDGLAQGAREGIPPVGPRGGSRWTARYFVRRVAWHTLDHAWEIEDRIL